MRGELPVGSNIRDFEVAVHFRNVQMQERAREANRFHKVLEEGGTASSLTTLTAVLGKAMPRRC